MVIDVDLQAAPATVRLVEPDDAIRAHVEWSA